jgi:hypothetical protein
MNSKTHALTLAFGLGLAVGTQAGSINNGLALHYPFDSDFGSSTVAVGEPTLETGKIGKAVHLMTTPDGITNNCLNLTYLPEFRFGCDATGDTTDFSVSFWVNCSAQVDDQAFIGDKNWGSGNNKGWVIAWQGNGNFKWSYRDDSGSGRRDGVAPTNIRDGQWHNIVVTFERTNVATTYVDGNPVHAGSIAPDAGLPVGSVDTEWDGLSVFVGNDGTGQYTDGGSAGADMLMDDLGIWRRLLSPTEVTRIYLAGLSGVNLASIPDPSTPFIGGTFPANGASAVSPSVEITFDIVDGSTQLATNTVAFTFDGVLVTPQFNKASATNTLITYDPPGLLSAKSAHTATVIFADNGTPATWETNTVAFTVADYSPMTLPAPIYLETFDNLLDGELPAGWTVKNMTAEDMPGPDFANTDSDSYKDWVVLTPDTYALATSYLSDLNYLKHVAPNQYVNGALVTSLISSNFILANADGRAGNQIQYLFTKDYDLRGQSNVYVSYHSMWIQNQDSSASMEYSIDEGKTWLPVVYMIDASDIIKDSNGAVDAVATLNTFYSDVATYTSEETGEVLGGTFGSFIGATVSATLAPYISGRVNDDQTESMRVELFRLPQADDQAKVRFRFATTGSDSWFWALDDLGLYSITKVTPPSVVVTTANYTIGTGNGISLNATVTGIGPFTYQWLLNNQPIKDATNETLSLPYAKMSDAGKYILQVSNSGGMVPSSEITLSVYESTAKLTGQWDFNNGDLKATVGNDLEYGSEDVQNGTLFGTTTSLGIPDIAGKEANVMAVADFNPTPGYIMKHGAEANGGGEYVNQYTLIMDLLLPSSSGGQYKTFLQTAAGNNNDADFFINPSNGIGISANYQGKIENDTWTRVALAVDLSGPGPSPIVAKFINGVKVGEQILGDGRDGRWSLNTVTNADWPYALLFADNDTDNSLMYLNSVQFYSGRLSDATIAAMGAPASDSLPQPVTESPTLTGKREGATIVLSYPLSASSFTVESATSLAPSSWTAVSEGTRTTNDSTITLTLPVGTANQFYRLKH